MFIPKRINVGFRDEEVANYIRLAYVIYWDERAFCAKSRHGIAGAIRMFQRKNLTMQVILIMLRATVTRLKEELRCCRKESNVTRLK